MRRTELRSFLSWIATGTLVTILAGCSHDREVGTGPLVSAQSVGRLANNRYRTPNGQMLTPAGKQVELPEMRPQALALRGDGKLLVTAGKDHTLVFINPQTGAILEKLKLTIQKTEKESETAQMSFAGLTFSPDGRHIYLSNTGGNVWQIPVDAFGQPGKPRVLSVPHKNVPNNRNELPTGIAVTADSRTVYVAGSLGNELHEIDVESGKALRSWPTGAAPFDVLLTSGKVYVSNLGGRRPGKEDLAAHAGRDTKVRVDARRHIASEGSVTVIDRRSGKVLKEILVGLHASALAVSPSGRYVVVANTGSDTLSVIDASRDEIVEKIWMRQSPGDLFGAQPNALAFDHTGRRLYVSNGSQNAIAVVKFEPEDNESALLGLIPVGWFPGGVKYIPDQKTLCVSNMKGIGATRDFAQDEPVKLSTKDFYGTVSLIRVPSKMRLASYTRQALHNMHYPKLEEAFLPARPDQSARPVPERIGEPSVFKHVIYIIKENRTYDQILGDMVEGNGDPSLCIFGEEYTPNQHKIAREFVLLDNTYCAGVQSADGHQWTDSSIANDYMERQISSSTPRSYPGGKSAEGADALAWASSGFIWDNVLAHGKTFRNYGEWMISDVSWSDPKRKGRPVWQDFYNEWKNPAGAVQIRSHPAIKSIQAYCPTNTVGWETRVPDQYRADFFIGELRRFETNGGMPHLTILFLPNDHTAGTRAHQPTPGAMVADNDLAFGRVVEAVSKSRFWPETCIFAIEDDPQNGWDHVSGYRTTCYVISPYTKRGQTISTRYNQPSVIRTMELILGLPPMNQMDGTAAPMFDVFMAEPNYTPFASVPNRVPLDEMNPDPAKVSDAALREDALASSRLPLDQVDQCPEDLFNRILWRAMKGSQAPYPQWAVKLVEDDDD
jgi:YVTN family beta-propeller protein